MFGPLPKKKNPLPSSECYPEMDTSEILGIKEHRKYKVLIRMLQWNYTIGIPELGPSVSSLN